MVQVLLALYHHPLHLPQADEARVTEFTENVPLSIAAETAAMESQSAADAAI